LPSTRLLHQPERRGRSLLSLSAGLDTTGSIAGLGGVNAGADGAGMLPASPKARGAGSRTVERRRDGSEAAVSAAAGVAACGG
jgi:hypothetical protein